MPKRGRPKIRPKDNKPLGYIDVKVDDSFAQLKKATPSAELPPLHTYTTAEIEAAELIIPSFLKKR